MDDEIICTDGSFPPDYVEFYRMHNVVTPIQEKLYHIREVVIHTMGANAGQVGILLEELVNPPVPIEIAPLGKSKREPTWNIKRFAHLNGSILTAEEVKEMARQHQLFKNLNF